MTSPKTVYIVDDDDQVRSSICFMLETSGLTCVEFGGGQEFLAKASGLPAACVLLDVRMPEVDGFQVMHELAKADIDWPIVIMTGHGEIAMAVRAMKSGAVDFVEKPFERDLLLEILDRAFRLLHDRSGKAEVRRIAKERVARLTPRELEVLQGLMAGLSNKAMARHFAISPRTVEMHRAHLMDRLQVPSVAQVLALAAQAGVEDFLSHSDGGQQDRAE